MSLKRLFSGGVIMVWRTGCSAPILFLMTPSTILHYVRGIAVGFAAVSQLSRPDCPGAKDRGPGIRLLSLHSRPHVCRAGRK